MRVTRNSVRCLEQMGRNFYVCLGLVKSGERREDGTRFGGCNTRSRTVTETL